MSQKYSEKIWTEKYRPKKIDSAIMPQRIRSLFIGGQIGDNYLFGGSPGTGKTTLAKILASGRSTLYIDASTERGIDTVREKIIDFASTNSILSSQKKVIILDESDKLTKDAQDALKATIEKYHQNVWYIFTANNPERLIKPLHSRLTFVNFNFTEAEEKEQQRQYIDRIKLILKNEGGHTITNDAVVYLLKNVYPDMRKIIKLLYGAHAANPTKKAIELTDLSANNNEINDSLYELLTTEYREEKLYEFIKSNYSGKELTILISLGDPFLEFLYKSEKHSDKVLTAAMITSKYIFEATTGSIDPLIPLLACAGALANLLR